MNWYFPTTLGAYFPSQRFVVSVVRYLLAVDMFTHQIIYLEHSRGLALYLQVDTRKHANTHTHTHTEGEHVM